jgi:hypothetical protein
VACDGKLLERAIGVVYRPDTERWSDYFEADLPQQFDAVGHLDTTTARCRSTVRMPTPARRRRPRRRPTERPLSRPPSGC